MFGNNASLFGNVNNTSTPTSTPTPATNNFQLPNKSNSLFGGVNLATGTSTPSPSSNTFGSNNSANAGNTSTTTSNLFGNKSTGLLNATATNTGKTSGGLFGGNAFNNATNIGAMSGESFGANASSTITTTGSPFGNNSSAPKTALGGLFDNSSATSTTTGGLFGNKPTSTLASTGLFGNSSSNTDNTNKSFLGQQGNNMNSANPSINTNPYGFNINAPSAPVNTMPDSITASLLDNKKKLDKTNRVNSDSLFLPQHGHSYDRRASSISSVVPIAPISQSSLIHTLSSRLQNGTSSASSTTSGIFSRSYNNSWNNNGKYKLPNEINGMNDRNAPSTKNITTITLQNIDISEMRKLKVEPSRSAAKKLKLLSGKSSSTKLVNDYDTMGRSDDMEENNILISDTKPSTIYTTDDGKVILPSLNNDNLNTSEHNGANQTINNESDYWCSPSAEQLSKLNLLQLAEVSDFVIGRKSFGYITFNFPVDLTAFAHDIKGELFGNIVNFRSTKTVEVYPEEHRKPQIGHGLNVPATITLENIYPNDKESKLPLKDASKVSEFQSFVKKLKNMREMEFISYNPHSGCWTFKVHHFSIWGLIEGEEEEEEPEQSYQILESEKKLKGNDSNLPNNQALKEKRTLAQSNSTDQYRNPNGDNQLNLNNIFITNELDDEEDMIIEERQYEPIVNEINFEGLDVNPKLDISQTWVDQLKIAGSSIRSIYIASDNARASDKLENINMFFNEFNQAMEFEKKVKEERRICSHTFARINADSSLLINKNNDIKSYHLSSKFPNNDVLSSSIFKEHLNSTVIVERNSNKYPIVSNNSLKFKTLMELYREQNIPSQIWGLCSVLFDTLELPYNIEDNVTKRTLFKKSRFDALCDLVSTETRSELGLKLASTSNALDKIFLLLAMNDVVGATKSAIESNNGHLAILITYLGSNNPQVSEYAKLQLEKWNLAGNIIEPSVARIYHLLSGTLFEDSNIRIEISDEFSWFAQFGLNLYFSKIDENSLEDLVSSILFKVKVKDDVLYDILKIFAAQKKTEKVLEATIFSSSHLDVQFLWYFVQILKNNDICKFTNHLCDRLTLNFVEQMSIAHLFSESLFATCFLSDDNLAKQQIDHIISHNILRFYDGKDNYILNRLKIQPSLIYNSLALLAHYNEDYLSEVKYLLHAENYKAAEVIIISKVAPTMILNDGSDLSILRQLLNKFRKESIEDWNQGLGVFEGYLALKLDNQEDIEVMKSLTSGLAVLYQNNKSNEKVAVCCSLMSQFLFSNMIRTCSNEIDDIIKSKLLALPVGQPEKAYLESVLASI